MCYLLLFMPRVESNVLKQYIFQLHVYCHLSFSKFYNINSNVAAGCYQQTTGKIIDLHPCIRYSNQNA